MQTQGTLQESNLASLLQTMQTERATGALALESQSGTASLYFLFGHLFHAAGPSGQGEDVVLQALSWHDGSFRFDPRAKLPPEETIKSSPSELIAEAEPAGSVGAGRLGRGPRLRRVAGLPGCRLLGSGRRRVRRPRVDTPRAGGGGNRFPSGRGILPLGPSHPRAPHLGARLWGSRAVRGAGAAAGPHPGGLPSGAGGPGSTPVPTGTHLPGRSGPSAGACPRPGPGSGPRSDTCAGARRRACCRPSSDSAPAPAAAAEPGPILGAPAAQPLDIVYPLPSGRAQYEGLKSAFVDFPKLLRTLRGDQHTGYIRLTAPDFAGILLFHQGHLLEALSSNVGARSGEAAFQAMRRSMDAGTGGLDVIDLAGETVEALAQLLTAPLLYTGLLGRFINFDALIAFLNEESVEGAVLVAGSADVGIILLSHGKVLGAYTQTSPALNTATTGVAKIAADKTARIEVKSGAGSVVPIDVENALSRAY